MVTTRPPRLPPAKVLDARSGRAAATELALSVFLGTLLTTFHSCPAASGVAREITPPLTGKTPLVRLTGVLPRTSRGCAGTIPIGPVLERSHTPVTGDHRGLPTPI